MHISLTHPLLPHQPTCHAALVMDRFGIGPETGDHAIATDLDIPLEPGQIVCFVGPSGSGKSSLLRAAAAELAGSVWLDRLPLSDALVVDGLGLPAEPTFELLTQCGLGEPRLMLRTPQELSDGERYRYRLARAAAQHPAWLIADEFTAILDRTLARVVTFNLRRLARKVGFGCLLATTHEGILDDLRPDIVVRCDLGSEPVIERRTSPADPPLSFREQLQIEVGSQSDWARFARWHYRGHAVACVRFVTVLKHAGRPIGICLFAAPARSLRARNRFFGLSGQWSRAQLQAQSAQLVTLSRVVLHPTYRGAGLASWFVRESCRLCPFPWIETLAELGRVHPLFERAGFLRINVPAGKRSRDGYSELYGKGRHGRGRLVTNTTHQQSRWTSPVYYIFDNRQSRLRSGAGPESSLGTGQRRAPEPGAAGGRAGDPGQGGQCPRSLPATGTVDPPLLGDDSSGPGVCRPLRAELADDQPARRLASLRLGDEGEREHAAVHAPGKSPFRLAPGQTAQPVHDRGAHQR